MRSVSRKYIFTLMLFCAGTAHPQQSTPPQSVAQDSARPVVVATLNLDEPLHPDASSTCKGLTALNGKFMGVGNGGFSGVVNYWEMDASLSRGYATASTNTGHDGGPGDASFALGHAEKVIDF